MEIEMLDAPEVREETTAIQQTSIALVQSALVEFDTVAAGLAIAQKAFAELEAQRAEFEAEKAAKQAADQKAIDDAALAAAPAVIEPTESFGEITIDAAYGDIEYITATAITDPSDADVIFTAARAVSLEYGLTMGDAIHRLAAVESWTQTEGATA